MLQLQGITRRFGNFTALDGVDFEVKAGEVVGLLGENGAGKSTLLNIVSGVLPPTSGELRLQGQPVRFASPRDATARGIGIVHQHFSLVPVFTVAENIALHAMRHGARYDRRYWEARVRKWAQSLGWQIDPTRLIETLSVGERQRVELLKALFSHEAADETGAGGASRLLLLDEPTANLVPAETEELFAVVRRLREQGRGIVFVSHKLKETLALCDRVVVLRRGKVTGARPVAGATTQELAALMVGRSYEATGTAHVAVPSDAPAQLKLDRLSWGGRSEVSLTVRRGEIVALAGVDGNGQAELVEVLSGLRPATGGSFAVADNAGKTPGGAGESRGGAGGTPALPVGAGIAVVPPDRQHVGLILGFDLAENMALHPALRRHCRRLWGFDWPTARRRTQELIERFDIRTPAARERALAGNLSGGNQQKVVVARALSFPHSVLVAADPTRGLDVAAAQFVHEQLRAAARETGVLLISTDLDEVLLLGDRIGVLYEGRLLPERGGLLPDELLPAGTPRETIGALMAGQTAGVPA